MKVAMSIIDLNHTIRTICQTIEFVFYSQAKQGSYINDVQFKSIKYLLSMHFIADCY